MGIALVFDLFKNNTTGLDVPFPLHHRVISGFHFGAYNNCMC